VPRRGPSSRASSPWTIPKPTPATRDTATAIPALPQLADVSWLVVAAPLTSVTNAKVEANPQKVLGTLLSAGALEASTIRNDAAAAATAEETSGDHGSSRPATAAATSQAIPTPNSIEPVLTMAALRPAPLLS
jgi:hypothetical protein